MRTDIKRICVELAKNYGTEFMLMECYKLIFEYCKKNNIQPSKNNYYTENGNLYINNNYIGKIAFYEKVNNDTYWNILENAIGYSD